MLSQKKTRVSLNSYQMISHTKNRVSPNSALIYYIFIKFRSQDQQFSIFQDSLFTLAHYHPASDTVLRAWQERSQRADSRAEQTDRRMARQETQRLKFISVLFDRNYCSFSFPFFFSFLTVHFLSQHLSPTSCVFLIKEKLYFVSIGV